MPTSTVSPGIPDPPAPDWSRTIDRGLAMLEDGVVTALVGAEVLILFLGVVARYGFNQPLLWSDELAATLFLWLAMLGSVVALRRGQHMKVAIAERRVGARSRVLGARLSGVLLVMALVTLLVSGLEAAFEDAMMQTPALQISSAWRAAAIPAGAALMLVHTWLRWFQPGELRQRGLDLAAAVVGTLVLGLAKPLFLTLGNLDLVVFFVFGLGMLLASGLPIAFAFALAGAGYLLLGTQAPLLVVANRMADGISHLTLLAIPLFVLLGLLLESTGLAERMLAFLANLLGHVRGGLSFVLIGAMYLFSGISGSKGADMAAVAPALFPAMKARGAVGGELVALLAATGAQTETVPPSLVLITVGSVTGVSIAALFAGGLLPAAVVGAVLCAFVALRARRLEPRPTPWAGWPTVIRSFAIALPGLVLPFLIRATVVRGVATATEVSTLGIVYVLGVALLLRRAPGWRRCVASLIDTAALSGAILLIIGSATALAWGLIRSGFAVDLARLMTGLPGGAPSFLALTVVVFVILGSVLEGIPAVVVFAPLVFPIARSLGLNPVHYAMVLILALGLGLFAPPLGIGYYTACAIGQVAPEEGTRFIWTYLWPVALGLLIVASVPWISTAFL